MKGRRALPDAHAPRLEPCDGVAPVPVIWIFAQVLDKRDARDGLNLSETPKSTLRARGKTHQEWNQIPVNESVQGENRGYFSKGMNSTVTSGWESKFISLQDIVGGEIRYLSNLLAL